MSIEDPTFTYDASKPLTEEQKRALVEAQRNPPALRAIEDAQSRAHEASLRAVLAHEARAHQWEHKQPIGLMQGAAYDSAGVLRSQLSEHEQRAMHGERLFRRSEVLAVVLHVQDDLRTKGIASPGLLAIDHVIRAIADME